MKASRLRTVKQIAQECPAFTETHLRWLLLHRQANGLASAVVTTGRKVFIDLDAFDEWLVEQG